MFTHKTYRKLTMVACLGLVSAISTQAMALASAELYNTQANVHGRFEARLRFAPGDGVISSFFLWKEGSSDSGAYWNELDFEKVGADCHLQANNIYGKPQANHETKPQVSGLCDSYHDYRFEWTPTYIAWFVDGKEVRRDTGEGVNAYEQNATAGLTFHFNVWPGNQDFGGNINNTTLPVHEYISWVQYSSYNNGSFELKWREDFQGTELPEGWVAGDWTSPFNLSTHNPKNVSIVNGIAVLTISADNGTGNPGTPPVDPNAGGSGGNGGTTGSGGSGGSSSSKASSSSGGSTSPGGSSGGSVSSSAGGSSSSGGSSTMGGTTVAGGRGGSSMSVSGGSTGGAGQGGSDSSGGASTSSAGSNGGNSGSGGESASSASSGGSSGGASSSTSSGGASSGGASSSSSSAQGGSSSSSSKSANSAGGSSSSGGSQSSSSGSAGESSSSGCNCRVGQSRHADLPFIILSFVVVTLLVRIRRKGV